MGFKADSSFLQKLTMGAAAATAAIDFLKTLGFVPIVLERYCTSNKIWTTKVKRLRLADLLCVRTGIRFEVRGKSNLQIKMSHSPNNAERSWDAGLRDDDIVVLVACEGKAVVHPRGSPVFFSAKDLRSTARRAKLGPPKSANEGAERDLTWPSIVPSDDGNVVEVTRKAIRVRMDSGRNQTYQLKGKKPYVQVGHHFIGEASILAGIVPRMVAPASLLSRSWSPQDDLKSGDATDRYAAAKALGMSPPGTAAVLSSLEKALKAELEPRTSLEIAGALARLGRDVGFEYLATSIRRQDEQFPPYLRMEAVLILSEIRDSRSAKILDDVAGSAEFSGNELRQAAVWGLGRKGVRSYKDVIKYIADAEDDVALHAIAAFGQDTPDDVIVSLVKGLTESSDARARASASDALRLIGTSKVAEALAAQANQNMSPPVLATLGRLTRQALEGVQLSPEVTKGIEPVMLLSESHNWLVARATASDFQFLLQQDL